MGVLEMFSLEGKVALVTGGAGNYGDQMVRALLEAGADVWVASRSLEKNEKYAEKLRAEGFTKVHPASYDQSSEESILALRDKIVAESGKCDILVNNSVYRAPAGVKDGWYDDTAWFEESMKVNAVGFFQITRAFAKVMAENKSGSIINIGSYMGNLGSDRYLYEGLWDGYEGADYFFHKGGVHNMTRLIASYYGPDNVRCNSLALGGLFNNQDPIFVERYSKKVFLHRMANQEDIKGMIVYLASDASQYMTGAVIPLDGGYSQN